MALGGLALWALWILATKPGGPALPSVNGERLANALASYSRDLARAGQGVPPSISLETLLQSGYLTPEDAKPFGEAKVTFYATADSSNPQSLLLEARMPDGSVQVVLADGSVQQFSNARLDVLRSNALSFHPTRPPQKILSTTNAAPQP